MANVSAPSASNSMSNVAQKRKQSHVSDKSKKKKVEKKQWDYEETVQLITSMEDASIRAKMDGMVHNSHVWKQIAECIPGRTGEQCHDRSTLASLKNQTKPWTHCSPYWRNKSPLMDPTQSL
jgi:DNA primase